MERFVHKTVQEGIEIEEALIWIVAKQMSSVLAYLAEKKNYAYGFETYVFQYVDLFSNIEHYIQILFLSISDIFMLRISEFLPKKLKRKFVKHDVLQNLYIERKHIFDLMLILNFMLLFALLKQTKIIYIIL